MMCAVGVFIKRRKMLGLNSLLTDILRKLMIPIGDRIIFSCVTACRIISKSFFPPLKLVSFPSKKLEFQVHITSGS